MNQFTVRLPHGNQEFSSEDDLHCPSLDLALVVADINLDHGTAEIWNGPRRLARMAKQQQAAGSSFWIVEPAN